MLYWFQLWREFKLSIAEILAIFSEWKIEYLDKKFLILDKLEREEVLEKANFLWWTIKIVEFSKKNSYDEIDESILVVAKSKWWKFNYGLSIFWVESNLKTLLINLKKYLKSNWVSSRFVNKDFENLSSAKIIWEKLVENKSDFVVISSIVSPHPKSSLLWEEKEATNSSSEFCYYFWTTVWVQDIDSYSKRDYWKVRDMDIWMLPPKLSQIMINLCKSSPLLNKEGARGWWLYDPFCGLGTILIEGVYMGIRNIYWSDFNPDMVKATKDNLGKLKWKDFKSEIIEFDARDMWENPIILKNRDLNIVTEGFLWEVMTKKNICMDRINIQKKNLSKLYEKFFSGLKKANFKWNIVISFPFWELNKKYVYLNEVYDILDKYCVVQPIFPASFYSEFNSFTSKSGSLLYKRKSQLVGREIFKLTIK